MALQDTMRSAQRFYDECERFVREYTAGMRAQDLRRLFDQEAAQAYDVLRRGHEGAPEPEGQPGRLLYRARIVFLGLSYKLTPARRLLLVLALLFALLGILGLGPELWSGSRLLFEASRFWFLLSIATLVFLLTLELVDQIRVRDELEVARQLQIELLPTRSPALPGWSLAHAYRTANEVGGDYYDFSILPDGRLALMVGDASGHGMAAGLLMAIANASLKLALEIDPRPVAVLGLLNRTLCRTGDRRAFMSLFFGMLDPQSGELEYAIAGHPFPLLRRASGTLEELGEGSLPLGVREELPLSSRSVTLLADDLLLLFSDGLPEAPGEGDSTFGYERIRTLLAPGGSPEAVRERLLRALDDHLDGRPLADDFSLVVAMRGGEAAQTPPPPPPA
jgi:hypothetical protein